MQRQAADMLLSEAVSSVDYDARMAALTDRVEEVDGEAGSSAAFLSSASGCDDEGLMVADPMAVRAGHVEP